MTSSMTALGKTMGCWLFANPISVTFQGARIALVALGLAGSVFSGQGVTWALSQQEVSEISQMGTAQGRSAEEMRRLIEHAERLEAQGLPPGPFLDKIKEGLAKGVEPNRMDSVLTKMATNLETANGLLKETSGSPQLSPMSRARSLEVLSEALGRGVSPDEVRSMRQAPGNTEMRPEQLAYGAKGLALMKEGGVPAEARQNLMASAVRSGFDSPSLLNLGREVKERREFRENPARFRELQSAVERGDSVEKFLGKQRSLHDPSRLERRGQDRPGSPQKLERLQRPDRPQATDRQSSPEPQTRPDRPDGIERQKRLDHPEGADRSARPDRPVRPERPVQPDRPDRIERQERLDKPDRADRSARPDLPVRPERPVRPDRPDRIERQERLDKPDRADRQAPPDRPLRPDSPARPDHPLRPDRPPERPDRPDRPDVAEPPQHK
jgi:hypothetical protein